MTFTEWLTDAMTKRRAIIALRADTLRIDAERLAQGVEAGDNWPCIDGGFFQATARLCHELHMLAEVESMYRALEVKG